MAASNPTDVFAMDDLRTIIGRNFITVVATRSQISAYIDKAYHQGGDAEAKWPRRRRRTSNDADEDSARDSRPSSTTPPSSAT